MDMNDNKTGRKTQSLAASQRRIKGEYPSPMQSAGPGDVTGPQAPGRAATTARPAATKASARPAVPRASARPAVTKASGVGKKETGHAKPDARSAASTKSNPKTKEATMNQEEHDMLVEAVVSIRHVTKTVEEIKQESKERDDALSRDIKEGDALLRQDIKEVDGRLWSAARWLIVASGTIIAALLGMIWQLVFGMPT